MSTLRGRLITPTAPVQFSEAELTALIALVKGGRVEFTSMAPTLNRLERARAELNGRTVFVVR